MYIEMKCIAKVTTTRGEYDCEADEEDEDGKDKDELGEYVEVDGENEVTLTTIMTRT